jgi:hypothetical protein
MSINNREDANRYYQLINGLVDDYIDNHKIRPSRLSAYLKPGGQRFNKFLERNKLKDIKGAEIILKDVIEDREHMEKDGVITFESFNILESQEYKISTLKQCLYKGIEKADLNMEKVLADYFDVNLGSIDVVDSDKHKFKIEDWKNDDWLVVIYSKEEIDTIKENLFDHFYEIISEKKIEIIEGLNINLTELINRELFENKITEIITDNKLKEIVTKSLGDDWSFEKEFREYFIFIS